MGKYAPRLLMVSDRLEKPPSVPLVVASKYQKLYALATVAMAKLESVLAFPEIRTHYDSLCLIQVFNALRNISVLIGYRSNIFRWCPSNSPRAELKRIPLVLILSAHL